MTDALTIGSRWLRKRDNALVEIVYVTPERPDYVRLVEWRPVGTHRNAWRCADLFLRAHDPAPPRDLVEHGSDQRIESSGRGHADQRDAAIAAGESR